MFFLSILPAECIEAESTYEHRDLNKVEKHDLRRYLASKRQPRKKGNKAKVANKTQGPAVNVEVDSSVQAEVANGSHSDIEIIDISDDNNPDVPPPTRRHAVGLNETFRSSQGEETDGLVKAPWPHYLGLSGPAAADGSIGNYTSKDAPTAGQYLDKGYDAAILNRDTEESSHLRDTRRRSHAADTSTVRPPRKANSARVISPPAVQTSFVSSVGGKTTSLFQPQPSTLAGSNPWKDDANYKANHGPFGGFISFDHPLNASTSSAPGFFTAMKGKKRQYEDISNSAVYESEILHAKPDHPSKRVHKSSSADILPISRFPHVW